MLVQINSETIIDWTRAGAVELWVWSTSPFMANDGTMVQSAFPLQNGKNAINVRRITCTVDTNAKTLTIPAITNLYSTTDGLDTTSARYSAAFFTPQGGRIKGFESFDDFRLNTVASQDWEDVRTFNHARAAARDNLVFTRTESDSRYALASAVSGPDTGVVPGSYTSADITVDAKGRLTEAVSGSGGITTGSQTFLGNKTFTGQTRFGTGPGFNEGAHFSLGATAAVLWAGDGSNAASVVPTLPGAVFQFFRKDASWTGVQIDGYQTGVLNAAADVYLLYPFLRFNADLAGASGKQFNIHGLRSLVIGNPSNVGDNSVNLYNWLQSQRDTAGIKACNQIDVINNAGDSSFDGSTQDSTMAIVTHGGGTFLNGPAWQITSEQVSAFSCVLRPIPNSIYGQIFDFSTASYQLLGTFSTNGTALLGVGSKLLLQGVVGDLLLINGTFYELTAVADNTHGTLATSAGVQAGPLAIVKNPISMVVASTSPIMARDTTGLAKFWLIGPDGNDHVAIDKAADITKARGTIFGGWQAHREKEVTLGNGDNNNINIGNAAIVYITGPSGAFRLGGFTGGFPGRRLTVFNTVQQTCTVGQEIAGSTDINRIATLEPGGVDLVLAANERSMCNFHWSSLFSRWIVEAHN